MNNKYRNLTLSELKLDLISELKNKANNKIIEQDNFEFLKKWINKAEDKEEAFSIASMGTTYNKTGFTFNTVLEHSMTDEIFYLKKNTDLSFSDDKNDDSITHKLIIGDNYPALLNLLIQYRNNIDVIYIDPPYVKDSMGDFAKTNYNNNISRDNLLSMLYYRLMLARQLLSDDGVIFCSIDDRNQAYVKGLFDEIFGEANFVGNMIWKSATDNNATQISTEHEYILCYANKASLLGKWMVKSDKALLIEEKYNDIVKNGKTDINEIQIELRKWINDNKELLDGVTHYNNVDEKGVYSSSQNSSNTKPGNYTYDILHPITHKPCPKPAFGWRWPEETFLEYVNNNDVQWGKDETTQPHVKKRINTVTELIKSIYYEDGRTATQMLEDIFGAKKIFDNPKPINLIMRLLKSIGKDDINVLDFFAGSGTTGQAVLELNREDGGTRKFILCTDVQFTDTAPNGIPYDITTKRLKRVMSGECYDGFNDFNWIKKNDAYGDSLDVLEIKSVYNANLEENKTPFDLIDETIYGMEKLSIEDKIEWVCNNFEHTQIKENLKEEE